jgi:transcription-repair coupling factor (superfamily II helicase)
MQLTGLIDVLRQTPAYQNLLGHLRGANVMSGLSLGVVRSARPYVLGTLAADWAGPIMFITARPEDAYNVTEQLPVWMPAGRVARFNEPTPAFYERSAWGEAAVSGRMGALAALMDDRPTTPHPVVVTSARALMQRTLPASTFRQQAVTLREADRWDMLKLLGQLGGIGYQGVSLVVEPGMYSRRGGIVDVYPVTATEPVRVEFFDDEIESIRAFDPDSQRSSGSVDSVRITPAREALPLLTPPLAASLRGWFTSLSETADDATSPVGDAALLESAAIFPFIEHYLPYLYSHPVSLLDYAAADTLIVVDDWDALRDTVQMLEEDAEATRTDKLSVNELPADYPRPYLTWTELEAALHDRKTLRLGTSAYMDRDAETAVGAGPTLFGGLFSPGERFGGMLKPMLRKVSELKTSDERVVIVTEQANRIAELWRESEGYAPTQDNIPDAPKPGAPQFVHGVLREGWTLMGADNIHLHLLTDAEIFGWRRSEPRRRQVARRARTRARVEYADWSDGDYVVHEDYGVGQFAGTKRRTIEGVEREYLLVTYAKGSQLFVPIHQADRVTRYVGPDDKPPPLTQLGGPEWSKTKSKTQKNAEEEARELLSLYAVRAKAPGYAFSPDTPWQNELEASFPYIETEDQLRAIADVKHDMQAAHPMDRLICGDAGYGKTEVAVRAAFKAVQDGKQVAILVPTTVLAQQHYETFKDRLAAFPIEVDQLSRFRTPEDQNKVIDRIATGEVDVIVGTHRILSKDIRFKELGLIVIDEEQRFGVKQKEHFKKLRTQVDILTLTATPIPRTMQMALSGVRDISMIQTPPEERLPVITHVGPFDRKLVRAAVTRELERSGQIFFVHNRVRTIQNVREQLEAIVPEARAVVAHGQMDGRTLGGIMRAFARGEYDILLSTSIVESGIDIPNANTLIVDRADWFGLAQLYQIRGRVGRGAQQAYAYIFHPPHSKLTPEARARLETVSENTQLGAGFQIALRDLEIRGAGDILSTKQSGHVAAVGLFLYTQMIANAVDRLKQEEPGLVNGEQKPQVSESVILDLPTPAYIPTDWIPEMALRLQIYRRIAALDTQEQVAAMREELKDRFGALPPAVLGLLYQIDVKILGQAAGATAIQHRKEVVRIRLPYLPNIDRGGLARQLGSDINVTRTAVEMPLYIEDMGGWQPRLLDLLEKLAVGVQAGVMSG